MPAFPASGGTTRKKIVETPTGPAKQAKSRVQPSNQYGTNHDPHKARSSQDPSLVRAVYDELVILRQNLDAAGLTDDVTWKKEAGVLAGRMISDPVLADRLRTALSLAGDTDMLWAFLESIFTELPEVPEYVLPAA